MRKLGLRAALTVLVLAAVALTALLIDLSWNYTARRNVGDAVAQLNRHIVDSVHRDFFADNYNVAWSTQEAVRDILIDGDVTVRDFGKLQSLFLALLRSQPNLSWIAVGRPDGDFIGVHRITDAEIYRVTVADRDGQRETEVERFALSDDLLIFKDRSLVASSYRAPERRWYKDAVSQGDITPTLLSTLPGTNRKALCFSAPVLINGQVAAVVAVAIDMDRLGGFLDGLQVGKTGTVVVMSRDGSVVAAADPAVQGHLNADNTMGLAALVGQNKLLDALKRQMDSGDPALDKIDDPREFVQTPAEGGESYFLNFSSLSFEGWIIATVIPGSDFLAAIDRNSRYLYIGLGLLTLLLALAAVTLIDRLITLPLLRVTGQLRHIERFDLNLVQHLPSPLRELDNLSAALVQMSSGLASFQKYMPTTLVRTLVSQGIEARPGGSQQELTVFFSDIEGFSGLSESLGDQIVPLLTDYLTLASGSILERQGTIDKFIGDAVMAFWGAPLANPQHATDACSAALSMQAKLALQRPVWAAAGWPALRARIGINSGRMLVGNIGSDERLNYTVIGDAVNVASRLEALNKRYATEILIGESTRNAIGEDFLVRRLDLVAVYGRVQGTAIFELLGSRQPNQPLPDWVALYEAGLAAYGQRDWTAAIRRFSEAADSRGGDHPSEIFIARCERYVASPPGADWSPLISLESKG